MAATTASKSEALETSNWSIIFHQCEFPTVPSGFAQNTNEDNSDVPLVLCNRNVRKMYDNSSYFSKPILSSLTLYPEALVKPSSAAFPNSTTNVHSKDARNVNESTSQTGHHDIDLQKPYIQWGKVLVFNRLYSIIDPQDTWMWMRSTKLSSSEFMKSKGTRWHHENFWWMTYAV